MRQLRTVNVSAVVNEYKGGPAGRLVNHRLSHSLGFLLAIRWGYEAAAPMVAAVQKLLVSASTLHYGVRSDDQDGI